jgi:hypothetical protein
MKIMTDNGLAVASHAQHTQQAPLLVVGIGGRVV